MYSRQRIRPPGPGRALESMRAAGRAGPPSPAHRLARVPPTRPPRERRSPRRRTPLGAAPRWGRATFRRWSPAEAALAHDLDRARPAGAAGSRRCARAIAGRRRSRSARPSAVCARPSCAGPGATYTPARDRRGRWSRGRPAEGEPGRVVDPAPAPAASSWPPGGASPRRGSSRSRSTRSRRRPAGPPRRRGPRRARARSSPATTAPRARGCRRCRHAVPRQPSLVRHHPIAPALEAVARAGRPRPGLAASQLAGLHVHFFLAPRRAPAPGDRGAFITAAEWLDVNYGRLVRELPWRPGRRDHSRRIEPRPSPSGRRRHRRRHLLPASRRAAARFVCGASRRSEARLARGRPAGPGRAPGDARRWSPLTRAARAVPEDHVELGELCPGPPREVTGATTWIVRRREPDLPAPVLFPRSRAPRALRCRRRPCPDRPPAPGRGPAPGPRWLSRPRTAALERFLARARRDGATRATSLGARRWWSVGLRAPAPILATYMARRPPAFVRNLAGARHINIAHGLYPREPPATALDRLLAAPCAAPSPSTTAAPTPAASPSSSRARWSAFSSPTPSPEGPLTVAAPPRSSPRRAGAPTRSTATSRRPIAGLPPRALRGAARAVPRPPRRVPRHHRGAHRADG